MDIIIFIAVAILWVYVKEKEGELDSLDTPAPADRSEQDVVGERCAEGVRYGHLLLLDPPEAGWKYLGGGDDAA